MAFPQTPLDVRTELQIGGAWTDVSSYVYTRSPITIERGRKDEGSRVDPSKCSLTLNNRDGRFSPRNPLSPYYGLIGRNTPIRVSVPGTESYLALSGAQADIASTPDHASLGITGDIDIRVEATCDWYTSQLNQTLIGQWGVEGNRAWLLRIYGGNLTLLWTTGGLASAAFFWDFTLPRLPRRAALRFVLDVNNGSGNLATAAYWSTSISGTWTQFGTGTGSGVTSIFNSTAPLEIGPTQTGTVPMRAPLVGRVHRAEVRNGIGGSVVANPDFTAKTPGTTSFADGAGRTWTVGGNAAITNREYRFYGEVSAWPPRWDVSGRDVWTPIEAAGIQRRLGQGRKPLDSTLRRRIPSDSTVLAYWPMEEDKAASQFYSPLAGVKPLIVAGSIDYATDTDLPGALGLPHLHTGASLWGAVPGPASAAGRWHVEHMVNMPSSPGSATAYMDVFTTGTIARVRISLGGGSSHVRFDAYDGAGTLLGSQNSTTATTLYGGWRRLRLFCEPSGGNIRVALTWLTPDDQPGFFIDTIFAGSIGRVAYVSVPSLPAALDGIGMGHLAVFNTSNTSIFNLADAAFAGDYAGWRMDRLAGEEVVPVSLTAPPWESERVGTQASDTLLGLLQSAADTDGGILYERRDRLALAYRDRISLYNQAVALPLSYIVDGEVGPPLEPAEDDQQIRNDVTVTRSGGSSARVTQTTGALSVADPEDGGVGTYDESVTLSLYLDSQAEQQAAWRVALGTWDEARYPTIRVMLHAVPYLIDEVLALDIGDRLTIASPPAWLPPDLIDQLAFGYSEVLDQFTWDVYFNCVPAGPWTVGVVEDDVLGRVDTDGCTLNGPISSSTTTVNVATAVGVPRWIDSATYGSMFPFDIRVGGEVMRVTNIVGTALSQTMTVQRGRNGITKAHASGTPVVLANPMRLAL
ncbi:hypothetical protein ABT160_02720 [Streptomyces sp. NPDC001941]|uniref:hypothetical protein n=1 Tax=Streptomyces sp. NPDC001941 TaxID=3154659 RepID=UPI00331A1214